MRLGQTFPRESHADAPSPERNTHVSRSRRSSRSSTAAAIPSRRRSATTSTSTRRSSRTGTTRSPARCACAGPASGGSPRCRCSRSATTATAAASPSTGPGAGSSPSSAWTDRVATWQDELRRKVDAGQADLAGELAEGAVLLGRESLTAEEGLAADAGDRHGVDDLAGVRGRRRPRARAVRRVVRALPALVRRASRASRRCCRSSPSSASTSSTCRRSTRSGTRTARARTTRSTHAEGDVGSPWAIGAEEGGHDALHPDLGTWKDFDALVAAAQSAGIEIALDFAIQCSPDHPWLKEHPEWFNRRPDGTLKYAENPPKRYQDIYNVNFESEDWRGLWQALLDVVLGWVERGVTVFRVDNPHTKPAPFWEWLIREVRTEHPEVIFLAEAFTRPAMMTTLAKLGFAQSYTYFTWKNTKAELRGVRRPAARLAALLPAEHVREHARHPPRVPAARRAAGVRGAARARGDAVAVVRHLLGLRVVRERRPCARAPRSTSTRRSTR